MTNAVATIEPTGINTVSSIENLAAQWLAFVDVAPSTLATYNRALKNFVRWLANNRIRSVNREVCISYRDNLLKNLKPTTCRLYVACLKLFIKFLSSKNLCPNFSEHFKAVKLMNDSHSRAALDISECREVLSNMTGVDEKSLRDKCIVALMMVTGLRISSVAALNVGDIQRRGKRLYLQVKVKARQGKQEIVLLPAPIKAMIDEYLSLRGNVADDSPLFSSTSNRNRGQRLQTQSISRICKKNLVDAGFAGTAYCAHSLRHSFASNALSAGVDVYSVSRSIHHRSVSTTEIYLHTQRQWNNPATSAVANQLF